MRKDEFSADDLRRLFEVSVPTRTEFELVVSGLEAGFCGVSKKMLEAIKYYVTSYNGFLDHQILNSYYKLARNYGGALDNLPEWLDINVLNEMLERQVIMRRQDRANLVESRRDVVDKAMVTTVSTIEKLISELASMDVVVRIKKEAGENTFQLCDLITDRCYMITSEKSSIPNIFG